MAEELFAAKASYIPGGHPPGSEETFVPSPDPGRHMAGPGELEPAENLRRHEPDLNADKHALKEHELTGTAVPKCSVQTTCWSAGFPVP